MPFLAGLISKGKCTLHELRTVYSMEDALAIWEATYVPIYNENLAREEALKRERIGL